MMKVKVAIVLLCCIVYVSADTQTANTAPHGYVCDNVYFEDLPVGDIKCRPTIPPPTEEQVESPPNYPDTTPVKSASVLLGIFFVFFFIAPGPTLLLGLFSVPIILLFHAIKPIFL